MDRQRRLADNERFVAPLGHTACVAAMVWLLLSNPASGHQHASLKHRVFFHVTIERIRAPQFCQFCIHPRARPNLRALPHNYSLSFISRAPIPITMANSLNRSIHVSPRSALAGQRRHSRDRRLCILSDLRTALGQLLRAASVFSPRPSPSASVCAPS